MTSPFAHTHTHCTMQGKMVHGLSKIPSARLLKHVVRCYLRLSDNPRFVSPPLDECG